MSSISCSPMSTKYIDVYSDTICVNASPLTIIGAKTKRDTYLTLYDIDSRITITYGSEIHILVKKSPSIYTRRYSTVDISRSILLKDGIYKDNILWTNDIYGSPLSLDNAENPLNDFTVSCTYGNCIYTSIKQKVSCLYPSEIDGFTIIDTLLMGVVVKSCTLSVPCKVSSSKGFVDRIVKIEIICMPRLGHLTVSDTPMTIEQLGLSGNLNVLPSPYTILDKYTIFFNILRKNKPQIRICNSIKTPEGIVLDLAVIGSSNMRNRIVVPGLLKTYTKNVLDGTQLVKYNTCLCILIANIDFFSVSIE